jgi:CubicO group peptidase (beta-lactamase class C family)
MVLRALLLLVATIVVTSQISAQQQLTSSGRAEIDAYLAQAVEQSRIPGLVAIVTSADGELYRGAFGLADVARGRAMSDDAIHNIASMTKPITSAVVMMLVEEGRLGLDDPIADHLPGVVPTEVFASFDPVTGQFTSRPAATPVTIRQLLSNTSGLGYPFSDETLFALIGTTIPSPSVTAYPLLFDPGARWAYGESTRVLGSMIEAVTGEGLYEFYSARVFGPLGMNDTAWVVPESKLERVVTRHLHADGEFVEVANPASGDLGGAPRGDGGLYSTASDYAKFLRMLLSGGLAPDGTRLLSADAVALMGENHIGDLRVELQPAANPARTRPFPLNAGRDVFGLGFQVTAAHDDPELRSPGSMSWAGIQNTQFWIDPSRGIGAVLLMQYLPFYDETALDVLEGFERRVYQSMESMQ